MSESDVMNTLAFGRAAKPQVVGHDALRTILDHERTVWNDRLHEHWMPGGKHARLADLGADAQAEADERWQEARDFATWAMATYRQQHGG